MRCKPVFATNNAHKLEEVSSILADKVELLNLDGMNCHTDIPEIASTLEDNAYLKPSFIYQNHGSGYFGDDTGLRIEALGGAPGIYSTRLVGGGGHNAKASTLRLMQELEGEENRRTQFRTATSLILDEKECLFEGVVRGKIIKEKGGNSDFGYDSIFIPEGYDRTFTELGNEIKNKISHRVLTVNELCELLRSTWLMKMDK